MKKINSDRSRLEVHAGVLPRLGVLLILILLFVQGCGRVSLFGLKSIGLPISNPDQALASSPTTLPASTASATPSQVPTGTNTPLPTDTPNPTDTPTPKATFTATPEPPALVFAAVGDYGCGTADEGQVADLINSWNPEFVITVGDNNYPVGSVDVIDDHIGQFYHQYIYPYQGSYGAGADINRFFPSLGNHDTLTDHGQPYLDYFELPGNERYYDFVWGPVHLFALDNDYTEPDGIRRDSTQAKWLEAGLAASTSDWNIVYMHLAPFSSAWHGSTASAQWPYKEWGADAVLAGHDHDYERLEEAGLPYFVNGPGGCGRYNWKDIVEGSQVRYNSGYGAMRVEATSNSITFQFINLAREVVDELTLQR